MIMGFKAGVRRKRDWRKLPDLRKYAEHCGLKTVLITNELWNLMSREGGVVPTRRRADGVLDIDHGR